MQKAAPAVDFEENYEGRPLLGLSTRTFERF